MKSFLSFGCAVAIILGLYACNQNPSVTPDESTMSSARTAATDSTSKPGGFTTVAVADLPAAITSYITTNYAGATIKSAKKSKKGTFHVVITQNNVDKELLFKADGTFEKELKPREPKRGEDSTRHHAPKDSLHHMPKDTLRPMPKDSLHHMPKDTVRNRPPRDTTRPGKGGRGPGPVTEVAVADLPANIKSYISTNYAGSTTKQATKSKDTGEYAVLITTADKKPVILVFAADGTFKKAITKK